MRITWVIYIGIAIIAGILVFHKNEDSLLKFFLFCTVIYVVMFFINLTSIYKVYE